MTFGRVSDWLVNAALAEVTVQPPQCAACFFGWCNAIMGLSVLFAEFAGAFSH
jgi:hypothetical protein